MNNLFEKLDPYNIDFKSYVLMKDDTERNDYLNWITKNRNIRDSKC